MTVRTRLGVAAVLLAAVSVTAFGAVAYVLFVRQQDLQLEQVLLQDLDRVTALLAEPRLGATLPVPQADGYVLQLVTADGAIALGWGAEHPLPLHDEPMRVRIGGRPHLAVATVDGAEGGTIRLAHDVSEALDIRARLLRSLVGGGLAVALGAGILGFVSTGRLLEPLRKVAARARQLDATNPTSLDIPYPGPADEVSDLVTALNTALSNIRAQKDEERLFLTEIAHELAAPLTLVSYHLDSANATYDDPSLRAAAGAAKELLRTSQDLLVLARGEMERPLELRVLDLVAVVERVAAEYPGIRTDAHAPGTVVADEERMTQAVRNLVRNAIQAAPDAAGVAVVLCRDGTDVALHVHDRGPGMRPEVAERVFDRLYSRTKGVGVGLSIAKAIVEQHGGSIDVRSELGLGSTFTIRLPAFAASPAG